MKSMKDHLTVDISPTEREVSSSDNAGGGMPTLNPEAVIKKRDVECSGTEQPVEYIVGCYHNKFFKVGEIEYEIMKLLNGRHSPEDIQKHFLETRDVEIPIGNIRSFIAELSSLGLVSYNPPVKVRKRLNINIPAAVYRFFSMFYRPLPLIFILILNLVGLVFFILNIEEIFSFITPYFSFHFVGIFILVYLLTSFFHELGHGAAIRFFNHKPGPIQIRLGNGLFLFHFSTPFIIYTPDKVIGRRMKLTIVSGGLIFDFTALAIGMMFFSLAPLDILKISGVLLQLTALSRILISINFFNENTDMAKILLYYFASQDVDFRKHIVYKLAGTFFWLLQYSVLFFIIYVVLYSVRSHVTLPAG